MRAPLDSLTPAQKERVAAWSRLQQAIAGVLRMTPKAWAEGYVMPAAADPLDFSYLGDLIRDFQGLDLDGHSFQRGVDPAAAGVPRVPLKAPNQLGRLHPDTQRQVAARLAAEGPPVAFKRADVVQLKKMFPGEKALSRLRPPDFDRLRLLRDAAAVRLSLDGGDDLVTMPLLEFVSVMRRPVL